MTDTTGEPLARTVADAMAERGAAEMGAVLWLGVAAGMQIGLGGIAYLIASADALRMAPRIFWRPGLFQRADAGDGHGTHLFTAMRCCRCRSFSGG